MSVQCHTIASTLYDEDVSSNVLKEIFKNSEQEFL